MKKNIIILGAVGILLALGSCKKSSNEKGNEIGPFNEDGSLTIKIADMDLELEDTEVAPYKDDEPAPDDELHTKEYITERVWSFYKLKDDKKCCSESYLKLRAQTEELAESKGTDLREGVRLMDNHWTLAPSEEYVSEDWSFEVMDVVLITKNRAMAVVNVNQQYGSKIKLHLVLERGDWYVDNFDLWTETSLDGTVEVYEEMEVYYNEKEMMTKYIEENSGKADEDEAAGNE